MLTLHSSVLYGLYRHCKTLTDWSRITEVESVYCAVRTESLYNADKFCLQSVKFLWNRFVLFLGIIICQNTRALPSAAPQLLKNMTLSFYSLFICWANSTYCHMAISFCPLFAATWITLWISSSLCRRSAGSVPGHHLHSNAVSAVDTEYSQVQNPWRHSLRSFDFGTSCTFEQHETV